MKVIKDRKIDNIDWEMSEEVSAIGNVIFPFTVFTENKDALLSRNGKTGVLLNGETPVEGIIADLDKLDLIALEFPVYVDGRCFSHASLLRGAHNYTGDLLAVGDILRDQVAHLERCGINLIRFSDHRDAEDALAAFSELETPYQSASDQAKTVSQRR